MDKNKQLIAVESTRALARVGVQFGLANKIFEEERKEYWTLRLNELRKEKLHEDLLKESTDCILEFSDWHLGYCLRSMSKNRLKDYVGAFSDSNKAIELKPNCSDAYCRRSFSKNNLKDYTGAISDSNKAISLSPNYADAYYSRGYSKNGLKDYAGAISDFDKAIELDPNGANSYNNRGNSKYNLKDYASAISDYNKAIELDPNDSNVYNTRGYAKYLLSDFKGAISDYDKALELNPNHKLAKNNRDIAIRKLKEFENFNSFEPEMVFVQGGTFQMGSDDENASDDEKPAHTVTVDSFYIGKYPVTQKQWRDVMGNNPSYFEDCDDCPIEHVSWNDVQDFLKKLNGMTGKNYRLPTEAEWEFAARGGTKSNNYLYSGSNDLDEVAWYCNNSDRKTHPVGQKKPNELGIYDMSGNVYEWCNDWYDYLYYKTSPVLNPKGPEKGDARVVRGGCWYFNYYRVSLRYYYYPSYRYDNCGFRVLSRYD